MKESKTRLASRVSARTPLSKAVMMALVGPAAMAQVQAQEEAPTGQIEEIVVTAQKREQSMQSVPISIEVLSNQTIRELNLQNFFDYAQMVPTITTTPGMDEGSSWAEITMRGVNSGSRGHASTNSPTVGMYLDEMPITTQQGNLDLHLYDVSRIEVLAGPQGTLYGGSAQAGTIRVITNRPELEQWSGSVSAEGNIVDGDDTGYLLEGFVNVPINEKMAVRLVGWTRDTAGWIDNVPGSRTWPGVENEAICTDNGVDCSADDITNTNDDMAADNYNTVETIGGRAALRIDLNENWTVSPSIMGQDSKTEGHRGEDISGLLTDKEQAVVHFMDEFTEDEWYMLGLTIEGRIGNFDVTYSGGYLERTVEGSYDYADYSYWYDSIYTTGYYADLHFSNEGPRAIENQFYPGIAGTRNMQGYKQEVYDYYDRVTHELRVTTDPTRRIRGMLGLFILDSYHDYTTPYVAPGLGDYMELHGGTPALTEDTVYLNSMDRFDDDRAIFGQIEYDITDDLQIAFGARFFEPEQVVKGFTGYGYGFNGRNDDYAGGIWSSSGEYRCDVLGTGQEDYVGKRNIKPCLAVDKNIKENESIYRVNLTYNASEDIMLYGTFSEGYRPGGINRNPDQGEFLSEFLTNYELGWKTQWMDRRLRFNGAVFYDEWDDFQITFAGQNNITQIGNGPSAEIIGVETELVWLATDRLRISAGGAYYDSELTSIFADYNADGSIEEIKAPKGTPLPETPDFKGNVVARYSFPVGQYSAYVQGAFVYVGERRSDLEPEDYQIRGDFPSLTFLDLAAGVDVGQWSFDLFVKNATDQDKPWYDTAQCSFSTCGDQRYIIRERPITFALKATRDFSM